MTFASQLCSTFTPIAAVYDAPSVTRALALAQSAVVNYCNQTFDLVVNDPVYLDPRPRRTALLPYVPVASVQSVSALLPPQSNTITSLSEAPSTTGGTFAAGTYYWVVTALLPSGEQARSSEVSTTFTGSTSSNVLSWTAIQGATGYNVYRGINPGQENVLVATVGAVTTYTDTGGAGTGQVPPGGMVWTTLTHYRYVSDTGLIYDTTGEPGGTNAFFTGPSWPWLPGSLLVTYTHGYSIVPVDVINVACALAQQYLENPTLQLQRRVGDIEDRFAGSIGVVIPDMYKRILDRYTDIGIA